MNSIKPPLRIELRMESDKKLLELLVSKPSFVDAVLDRVIRTLASQFSAGSL